MELKPGYKLTEVGVIPEDWDSENLGNFISLQRGHDLTWRDRQNGEVPVIGSAGHNGFHNMAIASGPGVILGRSGASFGQAHYCKQDFWPHNTALYVTDFKDNDPLFVFYFLTAFDFSRHNSGGAQQSLNRNFIAPLPVGVPPLSEQRSIATALSDMDELLGGLDRLIAKKLDLKQSAMQQLFRSKEGWIEYLLSEICWFQEGPGVRNHQFTDSGVKLFNGTNIEKGKIDLNKTNRYISEHEAFGWYSHFLADTGDIVIACSGISIDKFDEKVAVIELQHLPLCMNTSTMRFKIKQGIIDRYYLLHFLKSSLFRGQIGGTATGSAQLNFGPSHVGVVKIQLPELEEQIVIASILSDMDTEIATLEQRRNKTRDLKQSMMQELLTGRIRLL
jgi:type I restriction enzyme, S subunit